MKKMVEAEVRKKVRMHLRSDINSYREHGARFYDEHAAEVVETLSVLMEMVDLAMMQAAKNMSAARALEAAQRGHKEKP